MTGTRSKTRAESEVHVLNFSHDNDNCSALTVLVKDFRFHIIADPANLEFVDGVGKDSVLEKYKSILSAVKAQEQQSEQCHEKNTKRNPASTYRPRKIPQADDEDQGAEQHGPSSKSRDSDSGVDVGNDPMSGDNMKLPVAPSDPNETRDPGTELRDWMLQPFSDIFDGLAPVPDPFDLQTLHEWYSGPTYFYGLHSEQGILGCKQLVSQPELEGRIESQIPRISIPKYIRNLGMPWYTAADVLVLAASDEPMPYGPSRVQVGDQTLFFKAVDKDQPQTTRRELKILKAIERKGLQKQIRVPIVFGLVGWGGDHSQSRSDIMGFLQTEIESPTPLTLMLDSDVVEDKREKWARETERMVNILHDNDIVWGDAKADNFMVDRHGDLWIIDFGGSYTDGWVDPQLMETEEGDDMGVEKIVHALEDPEANTYDPYDESQAQEHLGKEKRTHGSVDEQVEEKGEKVAKKRRLS